MVESVLLYTMDSTTSNAKLDGYSIFIGTGASCMLQLPFSLAQSLVSPESIPKAVTFVTFAQLGAPSIMLSVANTVYLNEARNKIAFEVPSVLGGTVIDILSGVGSAAFAKLYGTQKQTILELIVRKLNGSYILGITSGALVVILSLFLSRSKIFA